MSAELETILIDDLGLETHMTDEQVHHVYNELAEVDKASTDNLAAAEEATESSNYTSEDNNIIEPVEEIPGVDVTPSNIIDSINETEKDIKDVLNLYDLDDEGITQMLKVIEEYKAGNTSGLYNRLPKKMQDMVNGFIAAEASSIPVGPKTINTMRNSTAKMLIDEFLSDAKMSTAVDEFNSEMASVMAEMNIEYDKMLNEAIDGVFSKIEEIEAEDPEKAERIKQIKNSFDTAAEFNEQLEFAKHTSIKKFNKYLSRFKDDVYYFNKRVNSNNFGVKVTDIEELIPVIKNGLPQYNEDDIKLFLICICKTIPNLDELAGIAYVYRMVSGIYKYKFTNIDENGEMIFKNISKVIDAIYS